MNQMLRHYGFRQHPFGRSVAKDAIFAHRGFAEALSRLRYSVELEAMAALVADSGCGKSLLLGSLAEELQQQGIHVHYFAHATVGPFSFINVLARKIGLGPCRSRGETANAIAQHLLASERRHLLVMDEAHELPDATLEDVRLLTIADFDRKSPFLLLLAGHACLDDRLAEPTNYALDQRITTVARLSPLALDETTDYVKKRLAAAGGGDRPVFDEPALEAVFDAAAGVPRRINNIATAALIVAAARGRRLVGAQDVTDAKLDRGRP
jgi:general secretion pathway protein A